MVLCTAPSCTVRPPSCLILPTQTQSRRYRLVLAEPRLVSLYTMLMLCLQLSMAQCTHTNTKRPIMYIELVKHTAVAA
jgi:hypothetical protein